jgi:hypothetical protein
MESRSPLYYHVTQDLMFVPYYGIVNEVLGITWILLNYFGLENLLADIRSKCIYFSELGHFTHLIIEITSKWEVCTILSRVNILLMIKKFTDWITRFLRRYLLNYIINLG